MLIIMKGAVTNDHSSNKWLLLNKGGQIFMLKYKAFVSDLYSHCVQYFCFTKVNTSGNDDQCSTHIIISIIMKNSTTVQYLEKVLKETIHTKLNDTNNEKGSSIPLLHHWFFFYFWYPVYYLQHKIETQIWIYLHQISSPRHTNKRG